MAPMEKGVVPERGSTPVNGPHQGSLIDLPNGQWWFLHFQSVFTIGRPFPVTASFGNWKGPKHRPD